MVAFSESKCNVLCNLVGIFTWWLFLNGCYFWIDSFMLHSGEFLVVIPFNRNLKITGYGCQKIISVLIIIVHRTYTQGLKHFWNVIKLLIKRNIHFHMSKWINISSFLCFHIGTVTGMMKNRCISLSPPMKQKSWRIHNLCLKVTTFIFFFPYVSLNSVKHIKTKI